VYFLFSFFSLFDQSFWLVFFLSPPIRLIASVRNGKKTKQKQKKKKQIICDKED